MESHNTKTVVDNVSTNVSQVIDLLSETNTEKKQKSNASELETNKIGPTSSDDNNMKSKTCLKCNRLDCLCDKPGIVPIGSELSDSVESTKKSSSVANAAAKQKRALETWSSLGVRRCENCKFTTDDASLFETHETSCSKKPVKIQVKLSMKDQKFFCQPCAFETSMRKKFEEHVALHLMAQPYICMTCAITFESKKDIELHVKMKHPNDAVKCGLKGSKRIGQIIENLLADGKSLFNGRQIEKRLIQTFTETNKTTSHSITSSAASLTVTASSHVPSNPNSIQYVTRVPSSEMIGVPKVATSQMDSVILVQPREVTNTSVSISRPFVPTTTPARPVMSSKPNGSQTAAPLVTQSIVPTAPLILVPVGNNILIPLSSIASQSTTQSLVTTVPAKPLNNVGTRLSLPLPIVQPQQNQFINIGQVAMPNPQLVRQESGTPGQTFRPNFITQNVPSNNTVNSQNLNQRFFILPIGQNTAVSGSSSIRQFQPVGTKPSLMSTTNIQTSKPMTVVSNKQPFTSVPEPKLGTLSSDRSVYKVIPSSQTVASTSLASIQTSDSSKDVQSGKNDQEINCSKLFFRKNGDLFICDDCKSETPLEESFKEHVWKHFHKIQNICKECSSNYDASQPCKIVLKVINGLLNLTASNQKAGLPNEVVTISDDEDDVVCKDKLQTPIDQLNHKPSENTEQKKEMLVQTSKESTKQDSEIVVQNEPEKDSCLENEGGCELKITSTFSLSESEIPETERSNDLLSDSSKNGQLETGINENGDKLEETNDQVSLVNEETSNIGKERQNSGSQRIDKLSTKSNNSDLKDKETNSGHTELLSTLLNIKQEKDDLVETNSVSEADVETKPVVDADADRKPIAFPISAFYKCGFNDCVFEAATAQEFREHLAQMHKSSLDYKCAHCGHKSFTEDSHLRHLLFHSKSQNTLLFHCAVIGCRFRANLLHVYKEHLEQAHQNVILHRCHSCKDGFNSIDGLIEHLQKNLLKFVQCPYCTMKDGNRRNVLNHIANHHPGKPRQINVTSQIVCQERETNEYVKTKKILSEPTPLVPTEETQSETSNLENDPEDVELLNKITSNASIMGATYYSCKNCSYIALGPTKLQKHTDLHTSFSASNQRPFVCPDCPQNVNTLQQFISHLNLHTGDHVCNVYICQHCGFGTNLSNKIHSHLTSTHFSNVEGKDYTQRVVKFSVTVTKCTKCNAVFKKESAHRDHVLKSHGITTNECSGKDDFNVRDIIPETVTRKEPEHVELEDDAHPRRFTCNECGWATKKLSYLKSHIKKHYPNQDRTQITLFKCAYCEYTSTSKLIISAHSQKNHNGKHVRVRRVVETVYITDTPVDDMSVDKFHCDLCSFSSDKISSLQSHMNCHSGRQDQGRNKDTSSFQEKQEFVIPYGTVFKEYVTCGACTFKTKKRIELLRHVKIHPSLELVSETTPDAQHSDKIQNPLFESYYKQGGKRKNSLDCNQVAKKPRPNSPTIDYDRILLDAAKRDTGTRKQVATKSTTNAKPSSSTYKSMLYYLGGEQLHKKLNPCFFEYKQAQNSTCVICSEVFKEKYNLHKHILQHMNVYFYKCAYCEHGTLDPTSIMVHIQRIHRRAIQYNKLDVEEIDSHINKAIHKMKSHGSSGYSQIVFEKMETATQEKLEEQSKITESLAEHGAGTEPNKSNKQRETQEVEKNRSSPIKRIEKEKNVSSKTILAVNDEKKANPEKENQEVDNTRSSPKKTTEKEKNGSSKTEQDKKSEYETSSPKVKSESISPKIKSETMFPVKTTNQNTVLVKGTSSKDENSLDVIRSVQRTPKQKEKLKTDHIEKGTPSRKAEKMPPVKSIVKEESPDYKSEIGRSKDESFNDATQLFKGDQLHPRLKGKNDEIHCTICNFKTTLKSVGMRHIWMHSTVRRYMCSICMDSYRSRWRGDIKKHIDVKHKALKDVEILWDDVTPDDITLDKKPFSVYSNAMLLSEFNTAKEEKPDLENVATRRPPLKLKLFIENKQSTNKKKEFKDCFKCIICNQTFVSKWAIQQHLRVSCKQTLYGCSHCTFKDVSQKAVQKHIKRRHDSSNAKLETRTRNCKIRLYKVPKGSDKIHGNQKMNLKNGLGSKSFRCLACKRTFKTRSACLYHAISPQCMKVLTGCSSCDFKSLSPETVETHIDNTHKDTKTKAIELPKESKVENINPISSTNTLKTNQYGGILYFTKDGTQYTCNICDFQSSKVNFVIEHQGMHNATPRYGCHYCEMKSNWIKNIKKHQQTLHPDKNFKWKLFDGNEKAKLKKTKECKKEDTASREKTESDDDTQMIMRKCLKCNYRCESYSGIFRHIKKSDECNVPRFKCTECTRFTSVNEKEVVDHLKTVHNSDESPGTCTLKEMTKIVIVRRKSLKQDNSNQKDAKGDSSRMADKFSGLKDVDTKSISCPALSCTFKDKVIKVVEHYRKEHPSKILRCKMCSLSSKSLGLMFTHFQEFHKLEDFLSTQFLTCAVSREELKKQKQMQKEEKFASETRKPDEITNAKKHFQCDRCEYLTPSKQYIRRHLYKHMNYRKYSCRLCKIEFLEQSYCEKHLNQIHNTEAAEFDIIRNERLEKEVESIIGRNVSYINLDENVETQKREESVKNDSNEDDKKSQKKAKRVENESALNKKAIEQDEDYSKLSSEAFNPMTYIREVVNKKTKDTEYLCRKCPYKSIARGASQSHAYRHMPKCMKCPYCSFKGYPRSEVTRHIKSRHPEKGVHIVDLRHQTSDVPVTKSPKKKSKSSFIDFDAEIFTSEGSSDEEIPLKHKNVNTKQDAEEQEKSLKGSEEQQKSLKGNRSPKKTIYSCHKCDYQSDVLYLFRQHLTFHPGFKHQVEGTSLESKNKCGYCGYISTNRKEFDLHMERHLNSRPYNCPYCDFSQYTPASVRYHIQNKHPSKKVEVLKDSSSSFLTGDGKVPKVMLVNFEPRISLTDIFTMESEAFEDVLINANVNVIDLHSIPDDQFGHVSKLLGVNGDDASDVSSEVSRYTKDDDLDSNKDDVIDGTCDMEIDERHYFDESDDETRIADDESQMDHDDLSDAETESKKDDDISASTKEVENKTESDVDKPLDTSIKSDINSTEYEDISDTEINYDEKFFSNDGEQYIIKSELTYEDISDNDDI